MQLFKQKWIFLVVLFVLSLTEYGLPLSAQKSAAQKPIKVDGRQLEGVPNFRDIGGYRTKDGYTIRRNVLYRSAQLAAMTSSDNEKLEPLKIRYEIDLRTEAERTKAPTHWGPNPPEAISIPYPAATGPSPFAPNLTPAEVMTRKQAYHAQEAVIYAPAIGQSLHVLAQGDAPAVIHCTGGEHRTGLTVAVLMTLLGASRQDVYREYLLSKTGVTEEQGRRVATVMNQPYPPPAVSAEMQKTVGVDASLLDAFFHSIDTHYGSFDAYVRDGLKLSKEDVLSLRRQFLTK